jgi:hypothetical protein
LRSWFSEASLKVMAADYKGVPEWAEVFRVAQTKAYKELQPTNANSDSIEAKLTFVSSA